MPDEIRALDDRTVREIAAGEVVERPASVVKELVENALDAGASRVAVAVDRGGIDGVRVRDDGRGMPPEQLPKAVAKHATSKLDGIDDLDAGVGTLGFRGEALHTVGAVSELTVRSRPADADAGAELTVTHGDVGDVEPAGCPTGTVVEVRDLFGETPARRKFLKSPATEFSRINGVVSAYALANPGVAVSLEHDGREVFASNGDGDRRSAVLAVYGREVAESMVDVDATTESLGVDSARDGDVAVTGLTSHPETTRAGREYLTTFVNGRWVRDAGLRSAVVDAYGGQLAPDRYPFAVLFVDVPPAAVDVNVHPRKTEVRFDDDAAVAETVEAAVREALLTHGLIRRSAPRGRSAPDEATVDPEVVGGAGHGDSTENAAETDDGAGADSEAAAASDTTRSVLDAWGDSAADDGDEDAEIDGDADESDADGVDSGGVDAGEHDADGTDDDDPADSAAGGTGPAGSAVDAAGHESVGDSGADTAEPDRPTDHPPRQPSHDDAWTDRPSPRGWQSPDADAGDAAETAGATEAADAGNAADAADAADADSAAGGSEPAANEGGAGAERNWGAPTQATLGGGTTDERTQYESLPSMRVLGQYDDTYLVCETDEGLVLVDQHAADERVNYERLRAAARESSPSQTLASPVTVALTAREAELFETFRDALVELGFRAERADPAGNADGNADGDADGGRGEGRSGDGAADRAVEVTAVPAVFDATLDPALLRDVLGAFAADVDAGDRTVAEVADALLADLACYPSVTGNTSLTEGSVADLLDALDDCENPYACPHGRPVVVAFGRDEIEDRFERDYPGHAGRRAE
ncbi:DNA mismatch repair endonuclease MutL [Halobaculum sp. D14]|uniref:DNA mismatch repair endonuclease MutL n=1 Tax=Halobaculum sp. D14 TaxID=3421642 RepID=UPI003EB85255